VRTVVGAVLFTGPLWLWLGADSLWARLRRRRPTGVLLRHPRPYDWTKEEIDAGG
jgi:hypothetical protein